jgi:hypothetical protein
MVEKKVTGVKSVTLGDVKAADIRTGIKSTPSASSSSLPADPTHEDIDKAAKELDTDIKDFDRGEKTASSKDLDKRGKDADTEAKKAAR